jgi:hypothetical protein
MRNDNIEEMARRGMGAYPYDTNPPDHTRSWGSDCGCWQAGAIISAAVILTGLCLVLCVGAV